MRNAFGAAVFFVCFAHAAIAADLSPPQRFEIYHGNQLFGFVTVQLVDGEKLVFTRQGPISRQQEIIKPSPEAWAHFRKRLDQLKVWKWKKNYSNSMTVKDGTQWRVLVTYKDKALDSSGSNAYPLPSGTSNNSIEASQHFRAFRKDVQDLIGRELR
ncbi:hypothetical protein AAII07_37210 [Microvirga sp. 0TCS3.31]